MWTLPRHHHRRVPPNLLPCYSLIGHCQALVPHRVPGSVAVWSLAAKLALGLDQGESLAEPADRQQRRGGGFGCRQAPSVEPCQQRHNVVSGQLRNGSSPVLVPDLGHSRGLHRAPSGTMGHHKLLKALGLGVSGGAGESPEVWSRRGLKTVGRASGPWVRIPPPPPLESIC